MMKENQKNGTKDKVENKIGGNGEEKIVRMKEIIAPAYYRVHKMLRNLEYV